MGVNLCENIELMLKDIPLGKLKCANHEISLANEPIAMPDYFYIRDNGKGRVDSYSVLPGVYISYVTLLAQDFYFYHNYLPKYNIFW